MRGPNFLHEIEDDEFLDPLNDTDLSCVHFAVLPEVNCCFTRFTESWNNHRLSTEGNMTPQALFALGLIERKIFNEPTREFSFPTEGNLGSTSLLTQNGMDDDVTVVAVPSTPSSVCATLQLTLSQISNHTLEFGRNKYMEAIQVVGRHIQSGCNECFV